MIDTERAFAHWREALGQWAIPADILDQAPTSPWIHPVELFDVSGLDVIPDSPSHAAARAGLPAGVTLLDIGCGGGRAAFACVPPAAHVIGVDHQQGMLDAFTQVAGRRGVGAETVLGDWPQVAGSTPVADVVTCHHVFYNIPDLRPFIEALDNHARRRVVVELPALHPLANLTPWWEHFWQLQRPTTPTAFDAAECVRALGHDVHVEEFEAQAPSPVDEDTAVRFMRIRLCLPEERDDEVRDFMRALAPELRRNVTLWWEPRH